MRVQLFLLLSLLAAFSATANDDSLMMRRISDHIMLKGQCYNDLRVLCKEIGNRLSASPEAEKAVIWGKKALKNWQLGLLGGVVLLLSIAGVNEVVALLGAGVVGAILFYTKNKLMNQPKALLPFLALQVPSVALAKLTTANVFLTFLKVGAVLYGSGYVLFAYLDAELVTKGWLTQQQLLDAVAIGQFTPGPVLSTATFIGYQTGGFWGAIGASLGIFLPSFLFVLILNPLIPKMRQSKFLSYFLDAVNIAAVAIMVAVLLEMGAQVLVEWKAVVISLLSFVVTFRFKKINVMWLILAP